MATSKDIEYLIKDYPEEVTVIRECLSNVKPKYLESIKTMSKLLTWGYSWDGPRPYSWWLELRNAVQDYERDIQGFITGGGGPEE